MRIKGRKIRKEIRPPPPRQKIPTRQRLNPETNPTSKTDTKRNPKEKRRKRKKRREQEKPGLPKRRHRQEEELKRTT